MSVGAPRDLLGNELSPSETRLLAVYDELLGSDLAARFRGSP